MKTVFVFGSNEAGRHGKGTALFAKQNYGAVQGQGVGRQGQSYGIPTKDRQLALLPPQRVALYVRQFIAYAHQRPHIRFIVTNVGCELTGYTPAQIAPMFRGIPSNCELSKEFLEVLQ